MRDGADMNVRIACEVGAMLGEGPIWDGQRGCLWFVDIKGHALHRFEPLGALESFRAPEEPGWVLPMTDGALLVGAREGVHLFDGATFELLHPVEHEQPGNRLNDAAVHPDGSVWLGTMDNAEEAPTGAYYRLHGGDLEQLSPEPMVITNGPAFSPDGGTVYLVDTLERAILAAQVGPDGRPGEARVFARLPEGMGYPDGPVVDSEGTVWVGLFGGWGVGRFSPDGAWLGRIEFPVANVTKIAFGGPDLKTVYATTARKGLSDAELARQSGAGDLFMFEVEVAGQEQVHPRPSPPTP
ncbi:SMP-30/gluconolactonase/LRE family protein [Novosphingobium sp. FGD1]|uniref:SMP-30/gluconolactonase/LRE family protein n=1 Tax=Novosphingobium silvae TaxID=2692619 RepID=A0A7X4GHJ0_9SPHN|nr:SMP-30/gluconolactonase/LRE family protein [Novosphingobium silvae]